MAVESNLNDEYLRAMARDIVSGIPSPQKEITSAQPAEQMGQPIFPPEKSEDYLRNIAIEEVSKLPARTDIKPMGGGLYREIPDDETLKRIAATEIGQMAQQYQAAPKMEPIPSPSGDYLADMAKRGELTGPEEWKRLAAEKAREKVPGLKLAEETGKAAVGLLEGGFTTAGQFITFPFSVAATTALQTAMPWSEAQEKVNGFIQRFIYQPKTERGQYVADIGAIPFEVFGKISETLGGDDPNSQAMISTGIGVALLKSHQLRQYFRDAVANGKPIAMNVIKRFVKESPELTPELKGVVNSLPDVEIPQEARPLEVPVAKPFERAPEEQVGRATVVINPNAQGGIDVEVKMPKKGEVFAPPKEITPEMIAEQKALRRQAAEEMVAEAPPLIEPLPSKAAPEIPGAKALRAKKALGAVLGRRPYEPPAMKFGKPTARELSYEAAQPIAKETLVAKGISPEPKRTFGRKPTEAEYYEAKGRRMDAEAAILEATGRPEKDINDFIKNTFMDGEELKRITDEVIGGRKTVKEAATELRDLVDATVSPVKALTPEAIRRKLAETLPKLAIPREKWGEVSRRTLENYRPEQGEIENYIRKTASFLTGEGEAKPKKGVPKEVPLEGYEPVEKAAQEGIYQEKETRGIIRSIVDDLPEKDKAIARGIMAGRSLRDDAKIMGITAEGVRKARSRVLAKLKEDKALQSLNSFDRTIDEIAAEKRKRPKKEPPIGLSLEQVPPRRGQAPKYEFSDKNREAEWQAGRKERATIAQKFIEGAKHIKNIWTRTYATLPNKAEFEEAKFQLKRLEKQRPIALYKTAVVLKEIVGDDASLYDRFSRKVILDDFAEEIKQGAQVLPFGFDRDSVHSELSKIDTEIAKYPGLKDSVANRKKIWDSLRESYIEAQESIGNHVEDKLKREDYYRHQVLKYAEAKNRIKGTGLRLRTPAGRSFLKERGKGGVVSTLPINIDYLEAESEVMQQMIFDIEVANTLNKIHKAYGIESRLLAEAKGKGVSSEVALSEGKIPTGYRSWQPKEGNVFYMTNTISERTARKILEKGLAEMGLDEIRVGQALAVGRDRATWVIPKEIADTLDRFMKRKESNIFLDFDRHLILGWKKWILSSPTKILKYNIRNLSGDAEHVFVGNPSSFKLVPRATEELWDFYVRKAPMTREMKDWYERGGTQATLAEQEIKELADFRHLYGKGLSIEQIPKETWRAYWRGAKGMSNMREAVLRYANYLDYLNQMEANPEGRPKNFGASKQEAVMSLSDVKDRAYKLSNDLLGAYDNVTAAGQAMREFAWPFWSWLEVNPKIYFGLARNALKSREISAFAGRKLVGSIAKGPITALRLGRFGIKAGALYALGQAANNLLHKEEEEFLPENVKNTQHIVLGKDKDGNTGYFSRMGALGDLFEWVGGVDNISSVAAGRKNITEFLDDIGRGAVNQIVQGINPAVKFGAEAFARKTVFPDVFEPKPIRNLTLHFFRQLGLANEYLALSDLPTRPYKEKLSENVIYKSDPLEASYYVTLDKKREWMKDKGKYVFSMEYTPKSNALYYMKLAHKYGQKEEEKKFLKEYVSYVLMENQGKLSSAEIEKKIAESIKRSYENMHPLHGIRKDDMAEFIKSLNDLEKRRLGMAIQFYAETLIGNQSYKPEGIEGESPK